MTWGITCHAQDEKLCNDPDCVRNDCKLKRSSAGSESAADTEMYRLRNLIASHIACEDDCQTYPSGCGCAMTAARAVMNAPAQPTQKPFAWVMPGSDTANDRGFIDAMAWEEGEFTKPLYASQPSPAATVETIMEATQAQHVGRKGEPARFTRNGILEICQCRECRDLPRSSAATEQEPAGWFCFVPSIYGADEPVHIRAWTTSADRAKRLGATIGRQLEPLYRAVPQASAESAAALRLLAAEDERQSKLHELLETIREQIRLEVAPEHRPEGLFKNIQDAVYAMRGRTRLMNDAAITHVLNVPQAAPENLLDFAWDRINALGGRAEQDNSYDQGFVNAIEKALEVIENLGGKDPLASSQLPRPQSARGE